MGSFTHELNRILRGIKAMYFDADAVDGTEDEPIYNWENAEQAITQLFTDIVNEAEPELPAVFIQLNDPLAFMYKKAIAEYKANLLKLIGGTND